MSGTQPFEPGGYRFIPAVFQYSSGVAALPGFAIRRVRFKIPIPMAQGFGVIERIIRQVGRPLTALCASELRSPAQVSDAGFQSFNEDYVVALRAWGLFDGVTNPVARSNVCPERNPPPAPAFHAFSFTVADAAAAPSFVIAGSGEARAGSAPYRERIIAHGDVSAGAMREKARFVLDEMERRLGLFGFTWSDTTATHVYTVHDLHPFLDSEIVRRGAAHAGLDWHYCRPPVIGLEYEMDCRAVHMQEVVSS